MAEVNESVSVKLTEAEIHKIVAQHVVQHRKTFGVKGKWKSNGTMASKDLDTGALVMTVELVRET